MHTPDSKEAEGLKIVHPAIGPCVQRYYNVFIHFVIKCTYRVHMYQKVCTLTLPVEKRPLKMSHIEFNKCPYPLSLFLQYPCRF